MAYPFSQARLDNPLLADKQYRQALAPLSYGSQEQEQAMVVRARAGEQQAREQIVLSLLPTVRAFAYRYRSLARAAEPRACQVDALDLVQVGNLIMVEKVEQALQAERPHAYLIGCAKSAIRTYCREYQSLVRRPSHAACDHMCWTESLEQPLCQDGDLSYADVLEQPTDVPEPPRDYEALYQAVRRLPTKQQEAVIRFCGLFEQPCEQRASDTALSACYYHAMIRLYEELVVLYPHYRTDRLEALARGGPKKPAYALTQEQRARLDSAYDRLQAGGHPVTTSSLQAEAAVKSHAAVAYLRERKQHEPTRHGRLAHAYARLQSQGVKITQRRLAQEARVGVAYVGVYLRRMRAGG
ncbi:MAG: sigma-70 family RNA polymerase sigma factor [Ktedonobacteraceae bacterium]|nr:sigma-70 family RNA polymerase sigma factor [Ktedonobacteraceae bacterium]